ncbi:uncharacterized protein LOC134309283 isoform X2 [Trichomycterus rosablanca]|uniref:uncharacterized protein LOC134309283 isoform X2 n=1 Tax=Trichomycterus rosablanca TaxID=2290929 RepID=UPI002F35A07F
MDATNSAEVAASDDRDIGTVSHEEKEFGSHSPIFMHEEDIENVEEDDRHAMDGRPHELVTEFIDPEREKGTVRDNMLASVTVGVLTILSEDNPELGLIINIAMSGSDDDDADLREGQTAHDDAQMSDSDEDLADQIAHNDAQISDTDEDLAEPFEGQSGHDAAQHTPLSRAQQQQPSSGGA